MASCSPDYSSVKELDKLCKSLFPADEPGAAVLVMRGDDIIFDKGYGIADIKTKVPIDGNTFFNIASCSKQFTSTALMQLAEKGLISLDDNIHQYFPEYKAAFWDTVCIKHLLAHSSGIPDIRGGIPIDKKLTGDDLLATEYLMDLERLNFEPGSDYEYINPTFVLSSFIVEKVTGMRFIDYVHDYIFVPANMERTIYFEPDKQELIPNMSHGYEYEDVSSMPEERTASAQIKDSSKEWYEYDYGEVTFFATKPDGGIYSSTHELINWEKALRNNSVMSEASREDAQSCHTKVSGSQWSDYQNRPNTFYGYGWFIEPKTDSTNLCIYHTGDNGGYKALVARYPESNSLLIILANRSDWDRYQFKCEAERIFKL